MNVEGLKAITQQLADVEPPPAPDWQPLIIAVAVAIVAIVLAIVVIRLRGRRKDSPDTRCEALRQLQLLQQAWRQGEVDDREAAYRLATLLRLGMGLNQLNDAQAVLQSERQQWDEMMRVLTQLRYTPSPPNALTTEIFVQIEQWLKQGDTPC